MSENSDVNFNQNYKNGGPISFEQQGETIILKLSRSNNQSTISWLSELLGTAAYGAYTYPRDVTVGIVWLACIFNPFSNDARQEAREVFRILGKTIIRTVKTLDDAEVSVLLCLIGLQFSSRGKAIAALAGRIGFSIYTTQTLIAAGTLAKRPDIGVAAAVTVAYLGLIGAMYRAGITLLKLKEKGESLEDGLSIILNAVLLGDIDIESVRKKLGSEAYDTLKTLLKNKQLKVELDDWELKFIKKISEITFELSRQNVAFFEKLLDEYKEYYE